MVNIEFVRNRNSPVEETATAGPFDRVEVRSDTIVIRSRGEVHALAIKKNGRWEVLSEVVRAIGEGAWKNLLEAGWDDVIVSAAPDTVSINVVAAENASQQPFVRVFENGTIESENEVCNHDTHPLVAALVGFGISLWDVEENDRKVLIEEARQFGIYFDADFASGGMRWKAATSGEPLPQLVHYVAIGDHNLVNVNYIAIVKAIRSLTGWGLRECRDATFTLQEGNDVTLTTIPRLDAEDPRALGLAKLNELGIEVRELIV